MPELPPRVRRRPTVSFAAAFCFAPTDVPRMCHSRSARRVREVHSHQHNDERATERIDPGRVEGKYRMVAPLTICNQCSTGAVKSWIKLCWPENSMMSRPLPKRSARKATAHSRASSNPAKPNRFIRAPQPGCPPSERKRNVLRAQAAISASSSSGSTRRGPERGCSAPVSNQVRISKRPSSCSTSAEQLSTQSPQFM
jgi:hypothetical protein